MAILGTDENRANSVLLQIFPNFIKDSSDNLAEVFGAGVKQKRSKFIDIRLERFLAPTSDICKGGYETQTNRGFKPSLSFTQ